MPKGFNGLAGDESIMQLQQALADLSKNPRYASANPGPVDGVMTLRVVAAVASVISELPGDYMPSNVKSAISTVGPYLGLLEPVIAQIPGASQYVEAAKNLISQNASKIAAGVRFIASRLNSGSPFVNFAQKINPGVFRDNTAVALPAKISMRNTDGTFRVASLLMAPIGKQTHQEIALAEVNLPADAALLSKRDYLKATGQYSVFKDVAVMAPAGVAVAAAGVGLVLWKR